MYLRGTLKLFIIEIIFYSNLKIVYKLLCKGMNTIRSWFLPVDFYMSKNSIVSLFLKILFYVFYFSVCLCKIKFYNTTVILFIKNKRIFLLLATFLQGLVLDFLHFSKAQYAVKNFGVVRLWSTKTQKY